MRIQPSAFRVQKYLAGLRYPAHKQDVLERARSRGADAQLLSVLMRLPERDYESPVSLSCEVGRQSELACNQRLEKEEARHKELMREAASSAQRKQLASLEARRRA